MKKHGILNSHLTKVFADLGHTDKVVIADCGLPIPNGVERVDLALRLGEPSFLDVLDAVESDMVIEQITIADEVFTENEAIAKALTERFDTVATCSHEDFKREVATAKVVIRTGEATPYANVILHAGVIF
ncbi:MULTISPECIES: D-ribose pyranase [Exiguobacterium]|uniref:D-ribose pyranase n=1 Tax=Exiguobacterium alkaliphilum TaxID=1428684 RepID=A0ABT2L0D0_9BACL|nr:MULTISPECIES: D-ribose pyranase [Exiguobacterium]MCT4796191.1 D-ribose pyranase [Exiguobacterium alkaliphilum]